MNNEKQIEDLVKQVDAARLLSERGRLDESVAKSIITTIDDEIKSLKGGGQRFIQGTFDFGKI